MDRDVEQGRGAERESGRGKINKEKERNKVLREKHREAGGERE